ncbi:MAG: excinuclease ABC subunit UvrC [Syntrophomonadaceae bacterium]|nr:excinuclease ABC subunit UvrC [Syntrophomonadaceae bacterium]
MSKRDGVESYPENLSVLKDRLRGVPKLPGVYLFKNLIGDVIYVGKAGVLRNRLRSYFQPLDRLDPKVRAMMARVEDLDYIVTAGEVEALVLESNLIKSYQPRYNILLRDDKSYPYLKITFQEDFPRLVIAREKHHDDSRYFGPYVDVKALKDTLEFLRELFPLRTCKTLQIGRRPCLNRDLGRCVAPCTGEVDRESYREMLVPVISFLEGDHADLAQRLERDMQEASRNLEFERAGRLRDYIGAVRKIGEGQKVVSESPLEADLMALAGSERERLVIIFRIRNGKLVEKDSFRLRVSLAQDKGEVLSFFIQRYYGEHRYIPREILVEHQPADREALLAWLWEQRGAKADIKVPVRGEKRRLLDMALENAVLLWEEELRQEDSKRRILIELARLLELEVVPERIECFDISHLGGEETVGSMVVFQDGDRESKSYRRFKLEAQNNDFQAMDTVLRRRLSAGLRGDLSFLPMPDLIMVDGGLGQVNAAAAVIRDLNMDIPAIGLAKKNEEVFLPGVSEGIRWPRSSQVLRLLQRIRDEAHRFAIEHNRKRIRKRSLVSVLDHVPGIGERRRQELLKAFGSVERIRGASVEELAQVPGMNRRAAQSVYDFFREDGGTRET